VLGLSIASSASLSASVLLTPVWVAIALLGLGAICSLLLNHGYARSLGASRRPLSRIPLDRLVATEIASAFALPLVVAGLVEAGVFDAIRVDPLLAVTVGVIAGVMVTCFLSGLVDWYYVLPRRDGLVGPPPCKAPHEDRWHRVTWFWFLHRFVAAVATLGGVYAIAICLGLWIIRRYPQISGDVGGAVPVLIGVVTFFGRSYLRYIGQVWQRLYSPSAALGEHMETKVEVHPLSGYVFNVSIERVDLLKESDVLTHASHADIAKHCQYNSRTSLCQVKCVRGNADATGKAPTGGHGGCLYETGERHLEGPVRTRAFVI
jgi:hypothetical protein